MNFFFEGTLRERINCNRGAFWDSGMTMASGRPTIDDVHDQTDEVEMKVGLITFLRVRSKFSAFRVLTYTVHKLMLQ